MSEAARLASIAGADGSSPLLHTDPHDWEASQATQRADSLYSSTDWESGVTTSCSLRGTHLRADSLAALTGLGRVVLPLA